LRAILRESARKSHGIRDACGKIPYAPEQRKFSRLSAEELALLAADQGILLNPRNRPLCSLLIKSDSPGPAGPAAQDAAPVALGDAPAVFVADAFARLAALKGGAAAALQALDHPDPAFLVFYRREALRQGLEPPAGLRELAAEEANQLAEALIADFRRLGAEGRLTASGVFAASGMRQPIAAELWPMARIEFAAGRMTSGALAYHGVTIRAAGARLGSTEPAEVVRTWLGKRRREKGEELRKTLVEAARRELGEAFTVRRFDAAYAALYERKRGRPKIDR